MTRRSSHDAKIGSIFTRQQNRRDRMHERMDKEGGNTPLESKIFILLEKWKKYPDAADSPTFHAISKKLSGYTTLDLIRMYHENKEALRKKCDDLDPECIIAFRQFHRKRNEKTSDSANF